jgi:hypothetical protein
MRFLLSILLTAVLAFVAGMYLEWWSIAIAAFLVALLLPQRLGRSFLAGFLGIFILWGVLAFWIDIKNDSLLSNKMAELFGLGSSGILLVLITALVGALVAGFAAMSGSSLRGRRVR